MSAATSNPPEPPPSPEPPLPPAHSLFEDILALYLQQKHGWRAGKLQMGVDVLIVLASLFAVSKLALVASILGAVVLNLAIAMNHRPGRYMAMS